MSSQAPQAVVSVGGSAGALEALLSLLGALPADLGLAIVFVSHLPTDVPSQAPEVLSRATSMTVLSVVTGLTLKADHLYVVSPGCAITLETGTFKVGPVLQPQHQIDRCFEALATEYGPRCIGVLLSGMNDDGVMGLQAIKLAGGITFVQDASAQSARMPRAALEAGCVDAMLSPSEMARELVQLARHPWLDPKPRVENVSEQLEPVIAVLRERSGVDFGEYRVGTLQRRILRRMALSKHINFKQYAAALRDNERETQALVQDILIGVTRFFRDPAAFAALAEKALPQIVYGRTTDEPRKVWILGCSTGEEAYSVAMLLEEHVRERDYQIFATDLNPTALVKARNAVYPRNIQEIVSPAQLRRFFDEVPEGYRIVKSVRDRCNFSSHNALSDPPFPNVDLICCRNVLIYMGAISQQKLISTVYRALRPQGVLFLGAAESLIDRELFTPIDAAHRIFSKRPNAIPQWPTNLVTPIVAPARMAHSSLNDDSQTKALRQGERSLLNQYAPAGVFVDGRYEILQYRGDTNAYLTHYCGPPHTNLLKMCREGMLIPLRACLQQAKRSSSPMTTPRVKVYADDECHEIIVRVIPVDISEGGQRHYWVMFEPAAATLPTTISTATVGSSRRGRVRAKDQVRMVDSLRERITKQTAEIRALRQEIQQTQEQQAAAQEGLRAANEEILSINEELLEKNSDLTEVQHDLQSANEELKSLIDELRMRNIALDQVNNELTTLVTHIQLPIIMVWADLKIRLLTPTAMRLLGASGQNVNRSISEFRSPIQQLELAELIADSIGGGRSHKAEVMDVEGCRRLLCLHPYHRDGHVEGAVAVLIDIHPLKDNSA